MQADNAGRCLRSSVATVMPAVPPPSMTTVSRRSAETIGGTPELRRGNVTFKANFLHRPPMEGFIARDGPTLVLKSLYD